MCAQKLISKNLYEAVILKKHFTEDQKKMMELEPVYINAWDEDY